LCWYLQRDGVPVGDVCLFDGLHAQIHSRLAIERLGQTDHIHATGTVKSDGVLCSQLTTIV
jgi:hypothetical protein